jgi:hypothetical protein
LTKKLLFSDSTGNIAGKQDIFLMRINDNANLDLIDDPMAWGFPENDVGAAIKVNPGGGYVVCGSTEKK